MAATLEPDLSELRLSVERDMAASPAALFRAWTQQFDPWFAAPRSVIMDAGINKVLYFETDFEDKRHPHFDRFLKLQPNALLEITWLTAATFGAETVVTVDLRPHGAGTLLLSMRDSLMGSLAIGMSTLGPGAEAGR